jgi:adenylate cyclase
MLAELFIVVAAIILASSFASFIARMIVRPLRMLQEGMLQVSKNDLKARVSILSPDELGTLADGFNDMVAGLNQRETLRNLLNHYVSPEVAKMALDSGALLGGQLVQCTILFSDLRNFTGISEKLAPQEMIQLLNRYMSLMVDVIVANGGIVTRFGGDSILAVFGTPLNPHSDHPLRAVRAALEMQRSLVDFNHSLAGSGMAPLVAGIGIATGEVVAGNVGGQQRMEYTVIGDPANLAARLQTMTKELGCSILLHGETYHAARRSLPLEAKAIPPLAVRGKSVPVEAFILQ